MLRANGSEATLQWAKGLVSNLARKPTGGDTDQLRAAAAVSATVANTYYFGRLIDSKKQADREVVSKLGVFFQTKMPGITLMSPELV